MSEKQEMTAEFLAKKSTTLFYSIINIGDIIRGIYATLDVVEALMEMSDTTEQAFFSKYKDMLVKFRDNLCKVRTNLEEKYSGRSKE